MSKQKYYSLLTEIGKDKIANATVNGKSINIVEMAVGDGSGEINENMTELENVKWRGDINEYSLINKNFGRIKVSSTIPEDVGGFVVREVGLIDDEGDLIVVTNYPPTNKPNVNEGIIGAMTITVVTDISNVDSVTVQTNPLAVDELRKDVEDMLEEKVSKNGDFMTGDLKIKDLSVYDGIAGTISAEEDTGEVTTEHRRQVNASYESEASGENSQVNSSIDSKASGDRSQVNASSLSEAAGNWSQVNASYKSEASGEDSQVNASYDSTASGYRSQVNASRYSEVAGGWSQVNASGYSEIKGVYNQVSASKYSQIEDGENWSNYGGNVIISGKSVKIDDSCGYGVIAGGGGATNDEPSTQNRKWQIDGDGEIKASGSITGNSSFADFAEYMESSSGEQIPTGTIVALDKRQKIRVAQEGDNPIGIISGTAGIILNAQGFEWKDRYLYDRYGQPIYVKKYMTFIKEDLTEEEIENEIEPEIIEYKLYSEGEEIPKVGGVVDGKEIVKVEEIETQQLNPDWDETQEYIPREDRDEWNVVGMKGQIYVNVDDTVEEGGYIKIGKDGIGTKGIIEVEYEGVKAHKLWQVMEITTPYNDKLGYGIARVII